MNKPPYRGLRKLARKEVKAVFKQAKEDTSISLPLVERALSHIRLSKFKELGDKLGDVKSVEEIVKIVDNRRKACYFFTACVYRGKVSDQFMKQTDRLVKDIEAFMEYLYELRTIERGRMRGL